ncbi:MAG: LuxR C-terminal-related transcriptional regulator [Sphingobium sp.]
MPDQTDAWPLRAIVAGMAAGDVDPATCEAALRTIGEVLGLSRVGFVPDIARPYISPAADAFFRRQGWPDDLLRLWWERRGPIKTGLYVRCRFAALPFVVEIGPRGGERMRGDEREMARLFRAHGLDVLLAVPVHLPRGRIALLVFAGNAPAAGVRATLADRMPDLLAAAHLQAAAWERAFPQAAMVEELSRLTPREWDCLRLLAQGCRDGEMARLNGIAVTTVRYHIDNVVRKLGAVNRTHAVALAAQFGMIGPLGN